eukprot:GHVU01095228.1.p1 GENE.GHVU01095228.1~~GHVU01095228.1.p1  ORF type:complete len:148 (+),score=11.78 GHVU01095228.1:229-672(+)
MTNDEISSRPHCIRTAVPLFFGLCLCPPCTQSYPRAPSKYKVVHRMREDLDDVIEEYEATAKYMIDRGRRMARSLSTLAGYVDWRFIYKNKLNEYMTHAHTRIQKMDDDDWLQMSGALKSFDLHFGVPLDKGNQVPAEIIRLVNNIR